MAYIEKGIYASTLRVGLMYSDDNDDTLFNDPPTSVYPPCTSLIISVSAS
jgi:hypothetical protein